MKLTHDSAHLLLLDQSAQQMHCILDHLVHRQDHYLDIYTHVHTYDYKAIY